MAFHCFVVSLTPLPRHRRYAVKALASMYKIIMGREALDSRVTPVFLQAQLARSGFADDAEQGYHAARQQFLEVGVRDGTGTALFRD